MSNIVNKRKEYAVSTGKVKTLGRRMLSWFETECFKNKKMIEYCKIEINKTNDHVSRMVFAREIEKNELELKERQEGFHRSSLRLRLEKLANDSEQSKIEKRGSTSPAGALLSNQVQVNDNKRIKTILTGYASKFWKPSLDMGFQEIISAGAFTAALKRSESVFGLINHDESLAFARYKGNNQNGNLKLYEDAIGLRYYATLPGDLPLSQTIISLVLAKVWTQHSFAFIVSPNGDRFEFARKPGELDKRIILPNGIEKLYDISIVSRPAYPDADGAQILFEEKAADTNKEENSKDSDTAVMSQPARYMNFDQRFDCEAGYRRAGRILARTREAINKYWAEWDD